MSDKKKILLNLGVQVDKQQVDKQLDEIQKLINQGKKRGQIDINLNIDQKKQLDKLVTDLGKMFSGAASKDKELNEQLENTISAINSLKRSLQDGNFEIIRDFAGYAKDAFGEVSKLAPKVKEVAKANQQATKETKKAKERI